MLRWVSLDVDAQNECCTLCAAAVVPEANEEVGRCVYAAAAAAPPFGHPKGIGGGAGGGGG